jgi:hypothetical protein
MEDAVSPSRHREKWTETDDRYLEKECLRRDVWS